MRYLIILLVIMSCHARHAVTYSPDENVGINNSRASLNPNEYGVVSLRASGSTTFSIYDTLLPDDTSNHWIDGGAYWTGEAVSLVDTTPAYHLEVDGGFPQFCAPSRGAFFYYDSAATTVQTIRYHVDSGGYYWAEHWTIDSNTCLFDTL